MKILVTGASGRVGANLTKTLLERGHSVRAFIFPGDASRMHKLDAYRDVEVQHGDLRSFDDVAKAVHGVDAIFHIGAAMIGPFDNTAYFDINAKGTFNVVEAARQFAPNLQRLIYSSTDATYPTFPDTEPGRVATEDMAVDPVGMYSVSKFVGERLVFSYHRQYQMPAVVVRFAWVIGAGEILDPNYVRMIWLSKTIERYRSQRGRSEEGDRALAILEDLWPGEERLVACRSVTGLPEMMHFVDIRDLLQGLLLALEKQEAVGDLFTLPGPDVIKFTEAVPYISERLGIPYVVADLPVHMRYRVLSWEKAHRVLGYTPTHGLAEMVELGLAMRRGEPIDLVPTGQPYGA